MYVGVLASEHYVSFLIEMGDSIGCHIPRLDCIQFIQMTKDLINSDDYFPEAEMQTDTMKIEITRAGDSIMFVFLNKLNAKNAQFTMDEESCLQLLKRLTTVVSSSSQTYGSPQNKPNEVWKFFNNIKKEAV